MQYLKNDNHHNITENLVLYTIEMDSFKLILSIGVVKTEGFE